jgi:hypothetical protein
MGLLARLVNLLRGLVGLVLPVFARARDFRGLSPGVRRGLHFLVLAAVLVGLGFANRYYQIGRELKGPPVLREYLWLPLIFFLIYVLCWLGWWLWKLLEPEQESSDYPDIDAAWQEALRALEQGRIGLADAPLFLVLGRPQGGEEPLFAAAQLKLTVRQAPTGPAPLHVYASPNGIYVTCAGASLLGRLADVFAGSETEAVLEESGNGSPEGDGLDKTLIPSGPQLEIQAILKRARAERREPTPQEKLRLRQLAGGRPEAMVGQPRRNLLRSPGEVAECTARLKHLCRLIVRDRRPYCPVNGILVLMPAGAGDNDGDADQTANVCHLDLGAAREALRVRCPVFALICDLETLPGAGPFLERFPREQLQQRLGQRYPLAPDLEPAQVAASIERQVRWVCGESLPGWVYRLLRLENTGREDPAEVVRANADLLTLMVQLRERQGRLARAVARGFTPEGTTGPPLFGGCYVAFTGRNPAEQGFVAGVFRRLPEKQSVISWTDQALAEEGDYGRLAFYCQVGVGVAAVVAVGLLAAGGWLLTR